MFLAGTAGRFLVRHVYTNIAQAPSYETEDKGIQKYGEETILRFRRDRLGKSLLVRALYQFSVSYSQKRHEISWRADYTRG